MQEYCPGRGFGQFFLIRNGVAENIPTCPNSRVAAQKADFQASVKGFRFATSQASGAVYKALAGNWVGRRCDGGISIR